MENWSEILIKRFIGKFHKIEIKLIILYGSTCWLLGNKIKMTAKLYTKEIRILKWIGMKNKWEMIILKRWWEHYYSR